VGSCIHGYVSQGVIGIMPTYEYLCRTCSHRFETWQKMIDEPLTVCPECGGTIRRVLYPAGVVFKGHGFYKTDYNGKGSASANGSSETGAANGSNGSNGSNGENAKSESASSESKPASSTSSESKSGGESKTSGESKKTATSNGA
jgi:putative FmdB family regulatory protein